VELASLIRPARRDIGPLFDRALAELDIPRQSVEDAWRSLAREMVERIDAGSISLTEAARRLDLIATAARWPAMLLPFAGVDDHLSLGLSTDEEWEAALASEFAALRDRLEGRSADDTTGSGAPHRLRRYRRRLWPWW
jgi:hypothetical protein